MVCGSRCATPRDAVGLLDESDADSFCERNLGDDDEVRRGDSSRGAVPEDQRRPGSSAACRCALASPCGVSISMIVRRRCLQTPSVSVRVSSVSERGRSEMKRLMAGIALAVCLTVAAPSALGRVDAEAATTAPVSVQLLAINDFHGNIEPPGGTFFGQPAGGAEYLATHIAALKAQNPNTIVVGAGDLIGASPLTSALFHDEPSIEALNEAGLQVTSIGNHEFDEGTERALRMQRGGCHPRGRCQDGDLRAVPTSTISLPTSRCRSPRLSVLPTPGLWLRTTRLELCPGRASRATRSSSNAKRAACRKNAQSAACKRTVRAPRPFTRKRPVAPTPKPLFPATKVITTGGIKVGFIGLTLEGTPSIVTPSGVAGLRFLDEADTANRYAAELKRQGVNTIVVLIHEGGLQTGGLSDCTGMSGAIIDIANRMSSDIDVVVSGHTHTFYICTIGTKLVTSASSFGRAVTDIDLTVESTNGEVVTKAAVNTIVPRTIARDPEETAIVQKYQRLAAPLANRVIGSITGDITRTANPAGESALGDVIADAQLAATRDAAKGNAVHVIHESRRDTSGSPRLAELGR